MIPPGSNGLYIRNLGIKHLYLSALKAGGTLPPLELIKIAGVDMPNENQSEDNNQNCTKKYIYI
jgi:oligoendopeptidase F